MPVASIITFDPTNSQNINDIRPVFRLGDKFTHVNGNTYQYVKFDNGAGNVASVDGGAAYWKDKANWTVTSDKTDNQFGAAIPAGVAGVFLGVITDLRFTWVLKEGTYNLKLLAADSNGAVGNKIFSPVADTDLDFRSEADASVAAAEIPAQEVGRQQAAGASDRALCLVLIP